jgi:PhoD related phosphatase
MVKLGPMLKFLGCVDNNWLLSIMVVADAADPSPSLVLSKQAANPPQKLCDLSHTKMTAWRWECKIPLKAAAQIIEYQLNGASFALQIPAKNKMPSIAYASCNGFSDPKLMKQVTSKNALWSRMNRLHLGEDKVRERRFGPWNLLLMGGDQVYSDAMWQIVPELKTWVALDWPQRAKRAFNQTMRTQVERFFEELYISRWSQPEVAAMLASIPSIMMWDDHDIFDGWGSYSYEQHHCPVYQGIFEVAKTYFGLFQQQSIKQAPAAILPDQAAFNQSYSLGDLSILVLDMRSERQPHTPDAANDKYIPDQILSEKSWNAIYKWLDAQTCKHLLVMSSIPVVHPTFGLLEKMLGFLPGQQGLEDDLRDHWTSSPHLQERLRMVHRLLRFSADKKCRVTLLSGDVHVAAVGVIESDRNDVPPNARVMNQLTSSGIVHPAPPAMVRYFLEQACKNIETIDRGVTAAMYEFPATTRRLIGARNFLTIEPDDKDRLWANWWVENEADPTTKTIHPVQVIAKPIEESSTPK